MLAAVRICPLSACFMAAALSASGWGSPKNSHTYESSMSLT